MFSTAKFSSKRGVTALVVSRIKSSSGIDIHSSYVDEQSELIKTGGNIVYGLRDFNGSAESKPFKYPVAVIFVLLTKLFESFSANGVRALYMRDDLGFREDTATIYLHAFNFIGQFCPLFGAILADIYIGNTRSIMLFFNLYGIGWFLLLLTCLPPLGLEILGLFNLALLLIAVGNGSSRACITALGAHQFHIPGQSKQLVLYFSWFYFIYYVGIFLSKILPPMVRIGIVCFQKTDCYPAVFGTLATAFFAAWFTFALGRLFYKTEKICMQNILLQFCGCIKHALVQKWINRGSNNNREHWLHYAIGRYDPDFINDVKQVLKLMKIFLPFPWYFALLAQQDSSWTFQAKLMNTTIAGGVHIQPDQVKAIGPIFLFIMIPIWQYIVKPLLKGSIGYELKPLKSLAVGGVCAALSFLVTGILQKFIHALPKESVNVMWQIPQFVLLMLGELLFSIPGTQFAFTQAPSSMKSVLSAAWCLNNAFGNLIVIICTRLNLFSCQANEFFFYSAMMFLSVILYKFLAYDYDLYGYTSSTEIVTNSKHHTSTLESRNCEELPCTSGIKISEYTNKV